LYGAQCQQETRSEFETQLFQKFSENLFIS